MSWMGGFAKLHQVAQVIGAAAFACFALMLIHSRITRVMGQSYNASSRISPSGSPSIEDLFRQTTDAALRKSKGCISCHENTGDPHEKDTVRLGCVDCHGGNPNSMIKDEAHV